MIVHPLMVEIFAHHLLELNECMDCEIIWQDLETGGPTRQQRALSRLHIDDARQILSISNWVLEMLRTYGDLIHVRVIDAVSVEGVAKSAQYGINYYPAVVINRQDVYTARDLDLASQEVADLLANIPMT